MKRVLKFSAALFITVMLAFFLAGCSKPAAPEHVSASPQPQNTPATAASTESSKGIDACALLTPEEISAVQGEPFQSTKPSGKTGAGIVVSQCYFELPTVVNSVVLTVNQKAEGAGARDPKNVWEEIFHRENEREKKGEEEEKKGSLLEIEGIGDEAFWTGTRVGGALFVLKGNSYIRISVGGAGDQAAKIEKSKKLAESALKRL